MACEEVGPPLHEQSLRVARDEPGPSLPEESRSPNIRTPGNSSSSFSDGGGDQEIGLSGQHSMFARHQPSPGNLGGGTIITPEQLH